MKAHKLNSNAKRISFRFCDYSKTTILTDITTPSQHYADPLGENKSWNKDQGVSKKRYDKKGERVYKDHPVTIVTYKVKSNENI